MEGATKLRAQLTHSFQDLDDPNRRVAKIGWMDWQHMDIEELAAEKKRDKERSVLDSLPKSMRVPHKYATSFWPSLVFGILAVLHALVLLMQHWSVGFNVWINFQEVDTDTVQIPASMMDIDDAEEERIAKENLEHTGDAAHIRVPNRVLRDVPSHLPTHARVVPAKGIQVLLPLEYFPTLGMTFEYHRRRYVYDPQQGWSKIRCRTDFALDKLKDYIGIASPERVVASQVRHGPNMFSVKQPTFGELYKKQILNPFSVFQIFCVLLWAIDDYLVYSFFSLFMVLMFEGTVCFQRLKSLQLLRGMGNPSRNVYVHRGNKWVPIDTTELMPGDIMSLTRIKPHLAKTGSKKKGMYEDEGGDICPADLLLLTGSTVVNEASLTGESVPQMKEGLTDFVGDMAMKGEHKMNVAYAGTKMLQCKGPDEESAPSKIPNPPDGGCVCFVLRTGFASAQGKLVRMIEGSQEKVKGHERETGLLLLLLFVFAMISSSYVLYHGMQDENRSKYELLLHCILIVTSVIRPELPMQMALAVNNSLMTLMKMHVFCTEPYRVPMAGKLDACLFDKTGTLTTDELVAVGVCESDKLNKKTDDVNILLTPMLKVHSTAALVLAGCHSLVFVDEETQGDPLESASLRSMRWRLNLAGNAAPAPGTEKKPAGNPITVKGQQIAEVEILHRHHFSSKLQRMSCVVRSGGRHFAVAKGSPEAVGLLLATKPPGYDEKSEYFAKQGYRVIALAMKPLDSIQKATESRASCECDLEFAGFIAFTCMVRKDTASVLKRLKEGGMSVAMVTGDALLTAIHVAKEVDICESLDGSNDEDGKEEEKEEKNEEMRAFLESKRGHKGVSVANKQKTKSRKTYKPILYLDTAPPSEKLFWRSYEDGSNAKDFSASEIPRLAKEYDLATTGKCLALAFEQDKETGNFLGHIKVFARMTPDAKERVIECLHSVGALCLMCGDGANDVGALKQADVGVALLSGFGNLNVEKAEEEEKKKEETKETKGDDGVRAIMSKEHLDQMRSLPVRLLKMKIRTLGVEPDKYPDITEKEDLVQLYQIKAREVAIKRHDTKNSKDEKNMTAAEKKAEQRKEMAEKQRKMAERTQELEAQGVSFASFKAMKEFWAAEMESAKIKKAEMGRSRGVEGSAATLAAQLDDMETEETPVIKLGDASVAAPFTSKMPSIRSCVDIVRQGRCTLVSSIQMVRLC
jgi:cation-transporting ATPase 13A1